jgi:DNA-binding NtrC family response regulator
MSDANTIRSEPIEVLLVDDEVGFVTVLMKRLQKRNICVTPATGGSEAIACFNKKRFDLVLLDIKMEFMDGIEVLKMIKDMKPEVPVIMITGHGSREEAQEALELGALECLPKPYVFEELLKKIHVVCNAGGADNG